MKDGTEGEIAGGLRANEVEGPKVDWRRERGWQRRSWGGGRNGVQQGVETAAPRRILSPECKYA